MTVVCISVYIPPFPFSLNNLVSPYYYFYFFEGVLPYFSHVNFVVSLQIIKKHFIYLTFGEYLKDVSFLCFRHVNLVQNGMEYLLDYYY